MTQIYDSRVTNTKTKVDVDTGAVDYQVEHRDTRRMLIPREELPAQVEKRTYGTSRIPRIFVPDHAEVEWHLMTWDRERPHYWYGGAVKVSGYQIKKDGSRGERPMSKMLDEAEMSPELRALVEEYHPATGSHPYTFPLPDPKQIEGAADLAAIEADS